MFTFNRGKAAFHEHFIRSVRVKRFIEIAESLYVAHFKRSQFTKESLDILKTFYQDGF